MQHPQVKVDQGELLGIFAKTINGKDFYSFRGIPYAEPPIADLRFKSPVPKKPWIGIKDATKEGNRCPQTRLINKGVIEGGEDCLFLNVSTPALPDSTANRHLYPVMVYIHGGGFIEGSGNSEEYSPDFFVEKGIVFVSINYRLGALGFLCLETEDVPGNAGLRDQSLALRWIQENIKFFNGDQKNITIFGVSAGSASVEYHMLSPMSRNLFHKGILQSGLTLNPWALTDKHKNYAKKLAKSLGIEDDDPFLLKKLQTIDVRQLVSVANNLLLVGECSQGQLFAFVPVVEQSFPNVQPFLSVHPKDLLSSGNFLNIPTITGFCGNEGLIVKLFYEKQLKKVKENNYSECLPPLSNGTYEELKKSFANIYKPSLTNKVKDVDEFFADLILVYGAYKSIKYRVKYNSVNFAYIFSFVGEFKSSIKEYADLVGEGAAHGSDIPYFASTVYNKEDTATDRDHFMRERMVQMWTDFAKYGNPTPEGSTPGAEWRPITQRDFSFIDIDDTLTMKAFPLEERMKLWDKYFNY